MLERLIARLTAMVALTAGVEASEQVILFWPGQELPPAFTVRDVGEVVMARNGDFALTLDLVTEGDESPRESLWITSKELDAWRLNEVSTSGERPRVLGLTSGVIETFGSFSLNTLGELVYEARLGIDASLGIGGHNRDLVVYASSVTLESQRLVARQHLGAPYARDEFGNEIMETPDGSTSNRLFGIMTMGPDGVVAFPGIVGVFPWIDLSLQWSGLWYWNPATSSRPELLFAQEMPVPALAGTIFKGFTPASSSESSRYFLADDSMDGGETGQGLWAASDPGRFELIVHTGDAAAGVPGYRFGRVTRPRVNTRGEVVFSAILAADDGAEIAESLWKAAEGGVELVHLAGETAAGNSALVFRQFIDADIDDSGQISFIAYLDDLASGETRQSIYKTEASGETRPVVIAGDRVPGGEAGEVFSAFSSPYVGWGGDLAFAATTHAPGGRSHGCWYVGHDGRLHPVAQRGDEIDLESGDERIESVRVQGVDRDGTTLVVVGLESGGSALLATTIESTVSATFDEWLVTEISDSTARDAMADPDADGLVNLAEYVFARDPTAPEREPLFNVKMDNRVGEMSSGALTFLVRDGLSDVVFGVEKSTDLLVWENAESELSEQPVSGGFNQITLRLPDADPTDEDATADPQQYFRIRLLLNP